MYVCMYIYYIIIIINKCPTTRQAEAGIALLSPGAQLPVAVAAELYKGILGKIEENNYDNFNTRAYMSSEQKLIAVPPL